MKTLWTFGDSFTDSFNPPGERFLDWHNKYIQWKGYVPKVFGEMMSEKLNMKLINKGIGGSDNSQIFESFCSVVDLIKEDDILIFGWTNQERFRLSNKKNEWSHLSVNFRDKDKKKQEGDSHFFSTEELKNAFDSISKNTIQEIMYNRMNDVYTQELCNWIKLINFSLSKNKILHWSWDKRITYCDGIFISGFETIKKETNNLINDNHWSENGHEELSHFFTKKLEGNETNDKKII
jgi:hypothetical protein